MQTFVLRLRDGMQILVKTLNGKIARQSLSKLTSNTIENVKAKIQNPAKSYAFNF